LDALTSEVMPVQQYQAKKLLVGAKILLQILSGQIEVHK
jgi:hypothetical protein